MEMFFLGYFERRYVTSASWLVRFGRVGASGQSSAVAGCHSTEANKGGRAFARKEREGRASVSLLISTHLASLCLLARPALCVALGPSARVAPGL